VSGVGWVTHWLGRERAALGGEPLYSFFLGIQKRFATWSLPQPHPPRPTPHLQVQLCVPDPLEALLALVDQIVQDTLALQQVCVPDPVGVLGVELVVLRHAPGVRRELGQELQVGRRVLLLLAA